MMMVWVPFIVAFDVRFINLKSRPDRLAQISEELRANHIAGVRIPAHKNQSGALGCALSHIDAVTSLRARVGLIMEDDATLLRPLPHAELEHPSFSWDVLLLAYNGLPLDKCYRKQWCRAINLQTTSMYAVRKDYIPTLLTAFRESVAGLTSGGAVSTYALDQTWKRLQHRDRWFAAVPRIAIQRPGFSDIELKHVDYKV
jgi:hypothetical protein